MEKNKEKKWTRRDFLIVSSLMLAGGKILGDVCISEYKKYKKHLIYNSLWEHIHLAKNVVQVDFGENKLEEITQEGYGIILDGKFIQSAHIINKGEKEIETSFGYSIKTGKLKERKVTLNNKEIKEMVLDRDSGIAIYELPKDLQLKNFPCKINTNPMLGEEVYIIGHPYLDRKNIRHGYISELNPFSKDFKPIKNCFGVDTTAHLGDSGCPVVNANYELLGICVIKSGSDLSYATKIEYYLEKLNQINEK